jgi:hypothetical protein
MVLLASRFSIDYVDVMLAKDVGECPQLPCLVFTSIVFFDQKGSKQGFHKFSFQYASHPMCDQSASVAQHSIALEISQKSPYRVLQSLKENYVFSTSLCH